MLTQGVEVLTTKRATTTRRNRAASAEEKKVDTMSKHETVVAETAPKAKKTRAPAKPRTVYALIEVLDENGNTINFDKARIRLLNIETKADRVLDVVEGDAHPHALVLRGSVQPGR